MTQRQELEEHRHSISEIRNIMNSMKTLAYMETRKISRFLQAQRNITESIREVAADFISFHPDTLPGTAEEARVYIVMGSERGFCGEINQNLLVHLEQIYSTPSSAQKIVIATGSKLHSLLEKDYPGLIFVNGASVVEEITTVLNEITEQLTRIKSEYEVIGVYGLHYAETDELLMPRILPPFEEFRHRPPPSSVPPLLNMSPTEFLIELTDQYLLAALYEMFYTSLMAENHSRVVHLEGAVRHLDELSDELSHRASSLRQEEITEEIEVILLSAERFRHSRL